MTKSAKATIAYPRLCHLHIHELCVMLWPYMIVMLCCVGACGLPGIQL